VFVPEPSPFPPLPDPATAVPGSTMLSTYLVFPHAATDAQRATARLIRVTREDKMMADINCTFLCHSSRVLTRHVVCWPGAVVLLHVADLGSSFGARAFKVHVEFNTGL
jgi:hypothetical protein